jgi:hypothetical protein
VGAAVTVPLPPRAIEVPLTVIDEFASPELGIAVLMEEAGMLIAVFEAAVI